MESLHLQLIRAQSLSRAGISSLGTPQCGPAAVAMPGARLKALGRALRRLVWPEAPQPVPASLQPDPGLLALRWHEALHYAAAGNVGASFEDLLWSAKVRGALEVLLQDYRDGKGQSHEEMILAESLDHVARTYFPPQA